MLGPGNPGDPQRLSNAQGVVVNYINNYVASGGGEFPPVTYSNGKKAFFASNTPFANPESIQTPGDMYTEHRIELKHVTDAVQDVLDEIDGFNVDLVNPRVYIEHAMGTIVGNRTDDSDAQNLYGKVLKPTLFPAWASPGAGHFKLIEATRSIGTADIEVNNQAGAYLFRINHPEANVEENPSPYVLPSRARRTSTSPARSSKTPTTAPRTSASRPASAGASRSTSARRSARGRASEPSWRAASTSRSARAR